MLRKRSLLLWVSATLLGVMAVAEGAMHVRQGRRRVGDGAACLRVLTVDLDGDGRAETVRLIRIGDQAWADVFTGDDMRSTTRLGPWHDDASIAAFDFNGDGRPDLVARWRDGLGQRSAIWFSDGVAFEEGPSGTSADTCVAQR